MLTRRVAVPLTAALLLGLAPPLTNDAGADTAWVRQFGRDFEEARTTARGGKVKVALLADGVVRDAKGLKGAVEKEKDLVGTPRPKRVLGTLLASLLTGHDDAFVPAATILPVRVYATDDEPGGKDWRDSDEWTDNLADGIRYAAEQGANVIAVAAYAVDYSFSDYGTIEGAIAYARAKNAVVVATSGRQDAQRPQYPAGSPGVVSIGVVDNDGRRDGKWTAAGSGLLVSAPGTTVPVAGPDGRAWTIQGDTTAFLFGTAAAAMLKARYPQITPPQIVQVLSVSARHPKGKGRYDTDLGFGYLNPAGALSEARRLYAGPMPAMTAEASVPAGESLGKRPEAIRAVPRDEAWLGGFGALAIAGLVALGGALWLALRKRRHEPAEPASAPVPMPPS
ncbi:S8 family serine peptidase [Actinomadura fibrosa]|uniref:S8 family serine peptidase n=1 Tax=Actinomadura fibrosa TaxID=111802 RepID=A0ABW2Y7G1_9ACTN|nr:S8 family serine peptidase [Actinomadura fibrosa]